MNLSQQLWTDYCTLNGYFIGSMEGISLCDIPDDLKQKVLSEIDRLEKDWEEKREKYELILETGQQ